MLDLTKPFQVVGTRVNARLITQNLRAPYTLAFVTMDAEESFFRTDLDGHIVGRHDRPFIQNVPDNAFINLYRRENGTLYVGQPKPTREEAERALTRNAPNNNMAFIKTIEISA